ncbi:MAG: SnoaL-like domain-containing protein [Candidatus Tokpelaia hoelldobleri]|uniref:SnoaL-like domain-containing protein n=1 Tax=Candidatus Tokpelaia hoelldobleri TaxID=1902579 RepID=A0A1U9JWQ6_9HYPH|nr:MAG: SnoaL-like domain-containing protein [Candidatus Tokpelaia hoelldoblerii]
MTSTETIRDFVSRAHHELFSKRDISALNRYFSADFIEHSPLVRDGLAGLQELVETHPALHYEMHRVLQDGDLVALHGRFTGLDEQPLVGFDLYRVAQGKIVEHWDGLVPEAVPNASGRTQLDGSSVPSIGQNHEKNRALVVAFFNRTLIREDYSGFRDYTDGKTFLQHSPDIADGVDSVIHFLETLKHTGHGLHYKTIHHTVADGSFVLTHSEGSIGNIRHAYFELWRVEQDRIVELWDAITPVPEDDQALHRHGIF